VFRLSFSSTASKLILFNQLTSLLISIFTTAAILFLTIMYYLFDNFSSFDIIQTTVPGEMLFFIPLSQNFLLSQVMSGLHPISVYYFPFLYIFVLITVLSILFCLAYNANEFTTFIFYCTVILTAGYSMFFTSSLLVFFLSYEMLLVPSFYILYNFSKTRKCVEAAYLMFFWTQFGALFLIFGFLYIFNLTGSHSFDTINTFYFSSYELNFIFMCLLIGFGVKLPIWPFYG
jgi:NADH:ubiquinone oxidoreductase subunit 4 (subunit M)